MTMQMEHGTPQKVLSLAVRHGVHNDCVVAGTDNMCETCQEKMARAFDFYYGDYDDTADMLLAIFNDYWSDIE
jgi:hypothetical protein